ncbi:hypothetical protein BGZ67_009030 [Mortierella alpina]|nr:hypothetical protein BGZ67_009030 [Mortierella alpina]
MEILRENFQRELPYIKEAIEECEFIAIDAEFSGLHTEPNKRTQQTTLDEGYEELRKSATQFLTVQIGITTFTFDPRNGTYLAKPFNFFIFPTTATGYSPQGRCFLTEASSLDFLAKNRFDFNKWVYQGVHYMTKSEEETYSRERTKMANNEYETIAVDAMNAQWIAGVIASIKAWKIDGKAMNFINIQTHNAYQRRLVYQEVRRLWPTELHARGQSGHICITKTTEKQLEIQLQQRQSDVQRDVENSIGFRAVIDLLSACGKPIVGHNIVIDLAYILAQFVGPLPPTMEEYKKMIHDTFPNVMDTKYVSYTAEALRGMSYDSSLGGLENLVGSVQFIGCPSIERGGTTAPEKKGKTASVTRKRKDGPAKSPVSPSASAPVAIVKPVESTGAPKKFSYADMVNRQKNASLPVPSPSDTLSSGLTQDAGTSALLGDAKVSSTEQDDDSMEDSGEESDYEMIVRPEMGGFVKPFSFQSPNLKCYQNILHWGRSSHGCINLTSS